MQQLIEQAEKQISEILAKLESDTGSVVESVRVYDIDETTYQDHHQHILRKFEIEMRRLPGTRWAV